MLRGFRLTCNLDDILFGSEEETSCKCSKQKGIDTFGLQIAKSITCIKVKAIIKARKS